MVWELILSAGLVSMVLGMLSGAQQLGPFVAIWVGSYIALAGLWGSPVSGASMNPARSLGPALVLNDWTAWWAYLLGPLLGAAVAIGIAHLLRGPGGGAAGTAAAQGTLGTQWVPGRIGLPAPAPLADPSPPASPTGPASLMGPASPTGSGQPDRSRRRGRAASAAVDQPGSATLASMVFRPFAQVDVFAELRVPR